MAMGNMNASTVFEPKKESPVIPPYCVVIVFSGPMASDNTSSNLGDKFVYWAPYLCVIVQIVICNVKIMKVRRREGGTK